MFLGKRSFAGIRRRAAMWLIAVWALFNVSQVIAACCLPLGNWVDAPAMSAAMPHDASVGDDCCDTPERPCSMVLNEAPPLAASTVAVLGENQHPVILPVLIPLRLPAAAIADRSALPVPPVPPDPIFLRLQRFLI